MTKLSINTIKSSSGHGSYKVTTFNDGSFWCTCPGFKFQSDKPAKDRQCKHTRQVVLKLFKKAS